MEWFFRAFKQYRSNRLLTESKDSGDIEEVTRYFYDNNGNQTGKTSESYAAAGTSAITITEGLGGSELKMYNGFNQLIQVKTDDTEGAYTYLPSGLRASKTVDGITTAFTWDGSQTVMETTGGGITAKYIRGHNLAATVTGDGTSYYLYNGHGDVTGLTDTTVAEGVVDPVSFLPPNVAYVVIAEQDIPSQHSTFFIICPQLNIFKITVCNK